MKRLILSGLDWNDPDEKNVDFLGPWCFLGHPDCEAYLRRIPFSPLYTDGREIKQTSDDTLNFSQRILPFLTREMNALTGRSYSENFWSLLLSCWLVHAVQVLYDRYLRLKRLIEKGEPYRVRITPRIARIPVQITGDFKSVSFHPGTNHYFFSRILQLLQPRDWYLEVDEKLIHFPKDPYRSGASLSYVTFFIFRRLKEHWSRIRSSILSRFSGIYIEGVYGINYFDILRFTFDLLTVPHDEKYEYQKFDRPKEIKPSIAKEGLVLQDEDIRQNEFESIACEILPELMPHSFLEDFKRNEAAALRYLKLMGKHVRAFVLGPVLMGGFDQMKFMAALHKERGGTLICSQHGGNYGNALSLPSAEIEYRYTDAFITWGWREHADYPVRALPFSSPMLSKCISRKNKKSKASKKLLLVMTKVMLFLYRMDSFPQVEQCGAYREGKIRFLSALRKDIREKISLRPYPNEVSALPERSYVKKYFPHFPFLTGDLYNQLRDFRMVIVDNPTTTLNVSLALDIPTLLFWDPLLWPICEQAEPYFERLNEVGILHRTPESAAQIINRVWDHCDDWWQGVQIRKARKDFCREYARTNEKWMDEWSQLFRNLKEGRIDKPLELETEKYERQLFYVP